MCFWASSVHSLFEWEQVCKAKCGCCSQTQTSCFLQHDSSFLQCYLTEIDWTWVLLRNCSLLYVLAFIWIHSSQQEYCWIWSHACSHSLSWGFSLSFHISQGKILFHFSVCQWQVSCLKEYHSCSPSCELEWCSVFQGLIGKVDYTTVEWQYCLCVRYVLHSHYPVSRDLSTSVVIC